MHVTRVELVNIKSHVHSEYDFGRGTTAITGENGAGKTTILEAIAWSLFDTLDYSKEDFLRRGAKKGLCASRLRAIWTRGNTLSTETQGRAIMFSIMA